MKILFAVNNDNISETVSEKYQRDYKEVVSYKNVYYFNAILKELQTNRIYDRVIISEDLEPFANNNYDTIDKFLFDKLEKIKEEATAANGKDVEIIIICADRRSKSDDMLRKLFELKIYNALIGDDRNIDVLCRLINEPRTKKEAKIAYKIEGSTGGQLDDESGVSELEVQNILAHYKRLGKNEDKYVDSFNNIVSQYTDAQLKIILRYLPLHVRAVLEERSPKYRQLSAGTVSRSRREELNTSRGFKTAKKEEKVNVTMLNEEKDKITKPIVIPSELNNNAAVKIQQKENRPIEEDLDLFDEEEQIEKKGRGRPRKNPVETIPEDKPKRGRGRPKKEIPQENDEENFDIDLFNIEPNEKVNNDEDDTEETMDFDLFNMNQDETVEEQEDNEEESFEIQEETEELPEEQEEFDLFNINETEDNEKEEDDDFSLMNLDTSKDGFAERQNEQYNNNNEENHYIENTMRNSERLNALLTNEKKIVSFVGTTKNGTSFIVNNLGLALSEMNISTAILDMTQNKNSYYIFTNNDERLRRIAENCIGNLEQRRAEGIKVEKNLTVYTEIPGEKRKYENIENILISLMEKHDVVLIDTDFDTNVEIFAKSHEIYLVQSMDILTIQPLTAFLRNLKSKNVLAQEKIKVIINKEQRLKTLNDNLLIGGMASYNDPSMTLMTELFNKDKVKYCKIPFEMQNYAKYLDSLVNCKLDLRGYTKQFSFALNELAGMVYPLLSKTKYEPRSKQRRMEFSNDTKNTLNKMKKNY